MKKSVNSKNYNKWKMVDIISFFIICIIGVIYTINSGIIEEELRYYGGNIDIVLYIVVVIICSLPSLLCLLAIYFGIRYTIRKVEKNNLTYNVSKDISYYRESLNDLNPFEVSMLANLNIEEKKDVIATILWYINKKYILIENNQIIYNETFDLNKKDSYFFNYLKTNDLGYLEAYKNMTYEELKQKNYIVENDNSLNVLKDSLVFIGLMLLVPVINIILVLINVFLVKTILIKWTIIITMILLNASIVYKGVSSFVLGFVNKKNRFKRTSLGEEKTELIHALQNFIHDFSNLKDADKEHVVLWDDFLVYAIILEENNKIIDDIGKVFNYNNLNVIELIKNKFHV